MGMTEALQGKRVLVIEDNYYLASDEAAILQNAGATLVGCTGDVEEACQLIRDEPIDCALVDINLGMGPTFEPARSLRSRQIPFLFTTGYDARTIPPDLADVHLLEKPVDPKKLLAAVNTLLSQ